MASSGMMYIPIFIKMLQLAQRWKQSHENKLALKKEEYNY
jgi:hypothetical protein